ncbi:MAG: hypothetical protein ACK5AL_17340 [Planctomycetota bacterium]|jgi:hypothetical protein
MAKKAAPASEAAVEAVGKPGLGIDEGIILTTSFLLALAITLVVIATNAYA